MDSTLIRIFLLMMKPFGGSRGCSSRLEDNKKERQGQKERRKRPSYLHSRLLLWTLCTKTEISGCYESTFLANRRSHEFQANLRLLPVPVWHKSCSSHSKTPAKPAEFSRHGATL
jgi:hypothetical protein